MISPFCSFHRRSIFNVLTALAPSLGGWTLTTPLQAADMVTMQGNKLEVAPNQALREAYLKDVAFSSLFLNDQLGDLIAELTCGQVRVLNSLDESKQVVDLSKDKALEEIVDHGRFFGTGSRHNDLVLLQGNNHFRVLRPIREQEAPRYFLGSTNEKFVEAGEIAEGAKGQEQVKWMPSDGSSLINAICHINLDQRFPDKEDVQSIRLSVAEELSKKPKLLEKLIINVVKDLIGNAVVLDVNTGCFQGLGPALTERLLKNKSFRSAHPAAMAVFQHSSKWLINMTKAGEDAREQARRGATPVAAASSSPAQVAATVPGVYCSCPPAVEKASPAPSKVAAPSAAELANSREMARLGGEVTRLFHLLLPLQHPTHGVEASSSSSSAAASAAICGDCAIQKEKLEKELILVCNDYEHVQHEIVQLRKAGSSSSSTVAPSAAPGVVRPSYAELTLKAVSLRGELDKAQQRCDRERKADSSSSELAAAGMASPGEIELRAAQAVFAAHLKVMNQAQADRWQE